MTPTTPRPPQPQHSSSAQSATRGATGPSSQAPLPPPPPPPLPSTLSDKIDLLISLTLRAWPALSLAIANEFGGPSSADKGDWFAGAISEMLPSSSPAAATTAASNNTGTGGIDGGGGGGGVIKDVEDLEDVLEQIMGDEFETVVEDGSLEVTAKRIWEGRARLMSGEMVELESLWKGWWMQEQRRKGEADLGVRFQKGRGEESSSEDEGEEDDGDGDEEMEDAPSLADVNTNTDDAGQKQTRKPEPEIDEDGFTKVTTGRRGKR